jgi:hypothetical protein
VISSYEVIASIASSFLSSFRRICRRGTQIRAVAPLPSVLLEALSGFVDARVKALLVTTTTTQRWTNQRSRLRIDGFRSGTTVQGVYVGVAVISTHRWCGGDWRAYMYWATPGLAITGTVGLESINLFRCVLQPYHRQDQSLLTVQTSRQMNLGAVVPGRNCPTATLNTRGLFAPLQAATCRGLGG